MTRFSITVALLAICTGLADAGPIPAINYPDFHNPTGLTLLGSAAVHGTELRLTPAVSGLGAAAWFHSLQPVTAGFSTTFQFRISDLGFGGADGFAFVVQRSSLFELRGGGGAIGYHGIPNSVAIEFDTWQNFDDLDGFGGDPNDNHISVHSNGRFSNSAHESYSLGGTGASLELNLSDGQVHTARINYVPGTLAVYVDDLVSPIVDVTTDLSALLNLGDGTAYVGFTAGTGGSWENHDILNWTFNPVPEPPTLAVAVTLLFALASFRPTIRKFDRRLIGAIWTALLCLCCLAPIQADIYKWQYIDPSDLSQGKRQSTRLAPDGAGLNAVPSANLNNRNLTMAYLHGADLTYANGYLSNLTNADLNQANLTSASFQVATLTGADLSHANLTNANFQGATLTGADFTDAEVRGASFNAYYDYNTGKIVGTGITAAQFYSTANYQTGNLTGVNLIRSDLSGWKFSGLNLTSADFTVANLTGADFRDANLTNARFVASMLTGADFTGAEVRGAYFGYAIEPAQLYSTASYQAHDLSGINLSVGYFTDWSFAGQNLTNASFASATLTGADFAGAIVRGADFSKYVYTSYSQGTGITLAQLYSTASYQTQDLSGINFTHNGLTGGNFADQNLTDANFTQAVLVGADFREANAANVDFDGAALEGASFKDAILNGATFNGVTLTGNDFSGADVRGASFGKSYYWSSTYSYIVGTGISLAQLYSTASYQAQDLSGIDFTANNLAGGNFAHQNLTSAKLSQADLTGADFREANLTSVAFNAANLTGADFRQATLTDAAFFGANLTGANFAGHVLANVNLDGAILTGADFTDADVRGASFNADYYDYSTGSYVGTGIAPEQLYATASYKTHDLSGIVLRYNHLSGGNFARQSFANANLEGADLTGATLSQANLTGVNLTGAQLAGANLNQANLADAHLNYATLSGANLRQANLANTNLDSAVLTGADFSQASLTGTSLFAADLSGAKLRQANLTNASFLGATLTDADFTGADIQGGNFSINHYFINWPWGWFPGFYVSVGTGIAPDQLYSTATYQAGDLSGIILEYNNLAGADFAGLNLSNASFLSANLADADLSGANLTNASLYSADLSGANLTGADMTGAYVSSANLQSTTSHGFNAEQLYSTASYEYRDLSGIILSDNDLSGWNFADVYLTNASFAGSVLTDANFAAAEIQGAVFDQGEAGTGLSLAQLYSTASYQNKDLTGVNLSHNNLVGGNFAGQNLSAAVLIGAELSHSNLANAVLLRAMLSGSNLTEAELTTADLSGATLTDANFTGAQIQGARFNKAINGLFSQTLLGTGITPAQLASTASYQAHDLRGINLAYNDLAGANFSEQNLTDADLSNATLTGVDFRSANLTNVRLYSAMLTGADFRNATLTNASVDSTLTCADFTGAEVRGASFSAYYDYNTSMYVGGISQAQLYSTASYQARDLTGIKLCSNDLSGANLAGQNLTGAKFDNANLAGANFTDAEVRGASFGKNSYLPSGTGITPAQLSSTASYQARDLTGINFAGNDLSGGNFIGQNLTKADFSGAMLTGANFTGAEVRGAVFNAGYDYNASSYFGGITPAQLYSTASYQAHDLTGISFVGIDLSGANFVGQNLTNTVLGGMLSGADFTNAEVRGAAFVANYNSSTGSYSGGITLAQVYSTASYKARDLSRINLGRNDLTGVNFAGQNLSNAVFSAAKLAGSNLTNAKLTNANFGTATLTGADFSGADLTNAVFGQASTYWICYGDECYPQTERHYATLTGANFTAADTRGAKFFEYLDYFGARTTNLIRPNGLISGLDLDAGGRLVVRDYDGNASSLDVLGNPQPIPAFPIWVDQHLTIGAGGTLEVVFDADDWNSTIYFVQGIPVALGGTLELTFAPEVNLASQVGRTLKIFDWTGVALTGLFTISSPHIWDLSQLYTTGEVSFAAVGLLPGDYNGNGVVDSADYTVWRDKLGSTTLVNRSPYLAGPVGAADYAFWKAHFGESISSGANALAVADGASPVVPEPSAFVLLAVGLATLASRSRRTVAHATVLFSCSWLFAEPALAVERIYNILSSQSHVAISGNVVSSLGTVPLNQQSPGSLTTSYSGTIRTDRGANTIEFLLGSALDANVSGNWQPLPNGSSGTAPADYGGHAMWLSFAADFAARTIEADLTSDTLTPSAEGTFGMSTTSLQLTGGSIDYRIFTALGTKSVIGLASAGSGTGSLTSAPTVETLSLPVNASYSLVVSAGTLGNATVNFTFAGQLVAEAALPTSLPGDYDESGTVDAADYTIWRDNLGSAVSLPNDDTPEVKEDDYSRWKNNFGRTLASGTPDVSKVGLTVPEPATVTVAAIAVGAIVSRRHRVRSPAGSPRYSDLGNAS